MNILLITESKQEVCAFATEFKEDNSHGATKKVQTNVL